LDGVARARGQRFHVYEVRMMRTGGQRSICGALMVMCSTVGASEVRADPLTFNPTYYLLDSRGAPESRLDLFSNPGTVLEPRTYDGTLPLSFVFGTSVDHSGGESFSDTIRFTYQEEGFAPVVFSQAFTTGTSPIRLGFGALFEPLSRTGRPVATTLRVELLNSSPDFVLPGGPNQGQLSDSYTYSFFTVSPTPEPSTLLLMGTGAVLALRRRFKQPSRASAR
jgi:hypothetical protein